MTASHRATLVVRFRRWLAQIVTGTPASVSPRHRVDA